ncbi:unnamed protein product [Dibothriocephalus latus]|uniref:Ribosome production factor 2 homolog n=1 Tax=Dibothriocephalus latus TaxID=60516 RepID=A0A3P7N3G8_DIBLA|nr:unnamed protein product [Dibothriocephalus latus]
MSPSELSRQLHKPKTHRGRKSLQEREPRVYENDKQTLLIRGAHTSQIVHDFLTDLLLLKKPLVDKLKWKNSVLPFEDASFIERMCGKFDSSLFVFGSHSKKRPNNIVIGRLHDHEILDMYELGIENYKSIRSSDVKFSLGAKPLLVFSGDAFEETEESQRLKSLLIDLFRGPNVSRVNSSGIEHVMHFIMPSENKLLLQVSGVKLRPISKGSEKDGSSPLTETLRAPWGPYVQVELQNSAPEVDFVLRRRLMPSEVIHLCHSLRIFLPVVFRSF